MATQTRRLPLRLDLPPHSGSHRHPLGQDDVLAGALSNHFTCLVTGRSWGKSPMGLYVPLAKMGTPRIAGQIYEYAYGAPFNDGARDMYRVHKRIFGTAGLLDSSRGLTGGYSDTQLILHLRPMFGAKGAVFDYWGLEEHDNLRRYRKHDIFVDEGKDVAEAAIFDTLMPMLLGREGEMMVAGSPKRVGKGARWLRQWYLDGLNGVAGHVSFNGPTHANPFITDTELERMIEKCRRRGDSVEEEIYGRFLEAQGAVFANLAALFAVPVVRHERLDLADDGRVESWIGEEPDQGEPALRADAPGRRPDTYVIGYDIGRLHDPSVAAVFNRRTRDMACVMRMTRTSFPEQVARVYALHKRYHGALVAYDRTGVGLGQMDEMARVFGQGAMPVVWSQQEKERDITGARILGSNRERADRWALLEVDWLRAEFEDYQCVERDSDGTPLARPRYGASPGAHDDGVTACILAGRLLHRAAAVEPVPHVPAFLSREWVEDRVDRIARGEHRWPTD